MKCIICRKNTDCDDDICHTCNETIKFIAKNPRQLVEYFRRKNGNNK